MDEKPADATHVEEIRSRLIKNSLLAAVSIAISLPIMFFVTPYMLSVLGPNRFGIWALGGAVTAFVSVSEMGLSTALVKFVAEGWVHSDRRSINLVLSTTVMALLVFGAVAVAGLILTLDFVIGVLNVPPELVSEARFVIVGSAVTLYVGLIIGVFDSVLQGMQRTDITSIVALLMRLGRAAGIVVVLFAGLGLHGLVFTSLAVVVLTSVLNGLALLVVANWIRVELRLVSLRVFLQVVRFGANIFGGRLLALAEMQINKIFLSRWTSLSDVTEYELGHRVSSVSSQVAQSALAPVLPATSGLAGGADLLEAKKLYLAVVRTVWIVGPPYFLLIFSLAQPFFGMWLGPGHGIGATVLQILVVTQLLGIFSLPAYLVLQGVGLANLTLRNHLIGASINVSLGIFLVMRLGIDGILITVLVAYALTTAHIYVSAARTFGVTGKEHLKAVPGLWWLMALLWTFAIVWAGKLHMVDDWGYVGGAAAFSVTFYLVVFRYAVRYGDRRRLANALVAAVARIKGDDAGFVRTGWVHRLLRAG